MSKYIDREQTVRELALDYAYAAAKMVEAMPPADVAPVVHAKWVWNGSRFICSECKVKALLDSDETDYFQRLSNWCPNCGARMGGEENAAD